MNFSASVPIGASRGSNPQYWSFLKDGRAVHGAIVGDRGGAVIEVMEHNMHRVRLPRSNEIEMIDLTEQPSRLDHARVIDDLVKRSDRPVGPYMPLTVLIVGISDISGIGGLVDTDHNRNVAVIIRAAKPVRLRGIEQTVVMSGRSAVARFTAVGDVEDDLFLGSVGEHPSHA